MRLRGEHKCESHHQEEAGQNNSVYSVYFIHQSMEEIKGLHNGCARNKAEFALRLKQRVLKADKPL